MHLVLGLSAIISEICERIGRSHIRKDQGMNKRPSQIYCISGNGVVSADARRQKTVGVNETNNDNGCLILAIICKDINVRTKRK